MFYGECGMKGIADVVVACEMLSAVFANKCGEVPVHVLVCTTSCSECAKLVAACAS
jgi:hypothetical protein